MAQVEPPRRRPRIFNTPFETGLRSVVILTACYPDMLGLNTARRVRSSRRPYAGRRRSRQHAPEGQVACGGNPGPSWPRRFRPRADADAWSRCAHRTRLGFRYRAGEEAGSFVDMLSSTYMHALQGKRRLADRAHPADVGRRLSELVQKPDGRMGAGISDRPSAGIMSHAA